MNEPEKIGAAMTEQRVQHASLSPLQRPGSPSSTDFRVMELETENLRLQRLVAELLLKNQQLRKAEEQAAPGIALSPASLAFAS
jgi:hypothetical protein